MYNGGCHSHDCMIVVLPVQAVPITTEVVSYIQLTLIVSNFRLSQILSKSRTSLCIDIYNLTPVESNSDESKFRLSRIKV